MSHDRYSSPFETRYASDEMQYIFSCLLYTSSAVFHSLRSEA